MAPSARSLAWGEESCCVVDRSRSTTWLALLVTPRFCSAVWPAATDTAPAIRANAPRVRFISDLLLFVCVDLSPNAPRESPRPTNSGCHVTFGWRPGRTQRTLHHDESHSSLRYNAN